MCRLTSNGAHRFRTNHPTLATELGWSVSGVQYAVDRLVKRGMIRKLAYHLGGYKQGTEYEVIAVSPGAHTEAERSAHAATDALIAAATNRHAINVDNVIVNVEDEAYTLLTLDLHFADTDIEPTSATAIESTLSVTPAELPSELHFTYTSLTRAGSDVRDDISETGCESIYGMIPIQSLEKIARGRKVQMKLHETVVTLDAQTISAIKEFIAAMKR